MSPRKEKVKKNARQYRPEESNGKVLEIENNDKSWNDTAGSPKYATGSTRDTKKIDATHANSVVYRHSLTEGADSNWFRHGLN
jgi:hypothetical protein